MTDIEKRIELLNDANRIDHLLREYIKQPGDNIHTNKERCE